jgi:hypothetical protein
MDSPNRTRPRGAVDAWSRNQCEIPGVADPELTGRTKGARRDRTSSRRTSDDASPSRRASWMPNWATRELPCTSIVPDVTTQTLPVRSVARCGCVPMHARQAVLLAEVDRATRARPRRSVTRAAKIQSPATCGEGCPRLLVLPIRLMAACHQRRKGPTKEVDCDDGESSPFVWESSSAATASVTRCPQQKAAHRVRQERTRTHAI